MEKCRYFHNAQTVAILSIDDLSFTASLTNGKLTAANDWGYGLNEKGGIYRYCEDALFNRYPEIRGTVFFPIAARHALQNKYAGYEIVYRDDKKIVRPFLKYAQERFEIAFHGTSHGRFINEENPSYIGNWQQEFEYLTEKDVPRLRREIAAFEDDYGIKFTGGKYPGYAAGKAAERIVEELGFKWWMRSADMIGRRSPENSFKNFGQNRFIVDIPTNIGSGCFRRCVDQAASIGWKGALKKRLPLLGALRSFYKDYDRERFLSYLYDNQLPVTIQTHFASLRTDGKRQTPSLYDDTASLIRIYAYMRGADIWHTTCGEAAEYVANYENATVSKVDERTFTVEINSDWARPAITVRSSSRSLKRDDGVVLRGVYKLGFWIYDHIRPGSYREE